MSIKRDAASVTRNSTDDSSELEPPAVMGLLRAAAEITRRDVFKAMSGGRRRSLWSPVLNDGALAAEELG